ncbi:MAG TPA: TerB family tellurite resistance protein [Bacteroidia bacterium]|nr:TerB family tellurite resistance protein [Bacteroidia bacterium]
MNRKLNKAEAGYHMLQLLAVVDQKFSVNEDLIIRNYLVENYPFHVNLDGAIEHLSILNQEDYILHFQKCMDDFYEDSTPEERAHFLNFAVQLAKADEVISKDENIYLKLLFDTWESENA